MIVAAATNFDWCQLIAPDNKTEGQKVVLCRVNKHNVDKSLDVIHDFQQRGCILISSEPDSVNFTHPHEAIKEINLNNK